MQGLTHDEAAAALSWPVGTVRSRLSRGRNALRRRLEARGMSALAAVGPLLDWPAADGAVASAAALAAGAGSAAAIPENVATFAARLASQAAAGSLTDATLVNVNTLALSEEVLKMMTFKKVTLLVAAFLSLATLTIGGGIAAVRTRRESRSAPQPARRRNRLIPRMSTHPPKLA